MLVTNSIDIVSRLLLLAYHLLDQQGHECVALLRISEQGAQEGKAGSVEGMARAGTR